MPKSFAHATPAELSAVDILSIPDNSPELLFPAADEDAISKRYRAFARKWHYDACRGTPNEAFAEDVSKKLGALREAANKKFENGTWEAPGEVTFTSITGKPVTVDYVKKHPFELGEMYIGQNEVAFAVRKEFRDLFENAQHVIGNLRYANDKMREQFERTIPQVESILETPERLVMVVKKDPKQVLLADYQENLGGKVDPKHAAWIGSRMQNIACFLEFNGLAHNAIAGNTVFVGLEEHNAALMGGWWYAARHGQPLLGLPNATVNVVPHHLLDSGLADTRVDLMLVRSVGRTMLGDATGMSLARDAGLPRDMVNFLTLPPMETAVEDFKTWGETLKKSFGERRFTQESRGFDDIYQQRTR